MSGRFLSLSFTDSRLWQYFNLILGLK
jgi:hypothetical protein